MSGIDDPAENWDREPDAVSHSELAERELIAAQTAPPAERFELLQFAGVHAQLAIAENLAGLRELLAGDRAAPGPTEVHVHTTGPTDVVHERMRNVASRYPFLYRNR